MAAFERLLGLRSDLASRAAALSFTANFSLMALKVTVGILTGSIAVLSDGIDSAEDSIASILAFISIRLATQPPDEQHPYGHGKAESIAAAGQGLLIAGAAGFIIFAAVQRLLDRDYTIETTPGLIALGITAVVNIGVVLYVSRAARITGSVALKADARHLMTNVVQAAAVIVALTLVATTGHTLFDPLMALALAVYLLWTAGQVLTAGMAEIMDVRLPRREERLIEQCLADHTRDGARGYHGLRTRKAGRQRYVDFHLLVDPGKSVAEAHDLCDSIEAAICACVPGAVVNIHVEPDDGPG